MQPDRDTRIADRLNRGQDMGHMAMHAAIRDQPHQMRRPPGFLQFGDKGLKRGIVVK